MINMKKEIVSTALNLMFLQSITSKTPDELAKELNTSLDKASLLLPIAMIYRNILEETDAGQIWISKMTICDGMAADFAEKKEKIAPAFNFTDGILSTARNIAARYRADEAHYRNVEKNCLLLFDAVKKLNNLTKHDRLLLQISAILHNCGNFINMNAVGENSYKIVMSTEIIGLSHKERMMVAYMVRYLDSSFPK